jgi:hypothetical protein
MPICNGLDSDSRFVAIRKDAHFHRVQQSPDSCGDSGSPRRALPGVRQESNHRRSWTVLRPRDESQAVSLAKTNGWGNPSAKSVSGIGTFVVLEPCAVKVASTVLRGRWRRNALLLPAHS